MAAEFLTCWSCGQEFAAATVVRDALIHGRDAREGGPYYIYNCPRCRKESKVERTASGRMFASPEKEIAIVDYLFSWIEPLTPEDFLRILLWHDAHRERRRAFFAREGDRRYDRSGVRGWIGRLFARSRRERPAAIDRATAVREEVVPLPYRILGVRRDASDDEIRRAFRALARRWHPDKQRLRDPATLATAQQRLRELLEAYDKLRAERGL